MKTVDFLDAVKRRHGLVSDYALAKFLKWRQQRVSEYRTTPRELDDDACVQIAVALELPPPYVLACIAEQRAKSDTTKRYWREAAKLLKTGTAVAVLVTAMLASQNAPRSIEGTTTAVNLPSYTLCALRRRRAPRQERRRRRRVLRRVIVSTDTHPSAA